MNRFVIADMTQCIGCRTCEIACVVAHSTDNKVSTLTPEQFHPRLSVMKALRSAHRYSAINVKMRRAKTPVQTGRLSRGPMACNCWRRGVSVVKPACWCVRLVP